MCLVKCVFREAHHAVEDPVRGCLVDSPGRAAGHILFRISLDKVPPFLRHDFCLLLGHGAAYQVAPPIGIPAQVAHNLHYLLLVDDAAVGCLENRLEERRIVPHRGGLLLAPDISRDEAHRARAVQGDPGDDILQAARLQLLHEALHACGFQLEDSLAFSGGNVLEHFLIVCIDAVHVQVAVFVLRALFPDLAPPAKPGNTHLLPLGYHPGSFLDHRQVAQAQEVHLQKPQVFYCVFRELRHDIAFGGESEGDEIIHTPLADHNARRVGADVSGQPFKLTRHINQGMDPGVIFIQIPQFLADLQRNVNGHAGRGIQGIAHRNLLRDRVTQRIWKIHDPSHIPHHAAGLQCTKGNDLGNIFLAISAHDIVKYL